MMCWEKNSYIPLGKKRVEIHRHLQNIYNNMEKAEVTKTEIIKEKQLTSGLHIFNRQIEEKWRMKSISLWLSSGDRNTTYFHK